MHRFFVNFHKSASDRASEIQQRAYNRLWRLRSSSLAKLGTVGLNHYKQIMKFKNKYSHR